MKVKYLFMAAIVLLRCVNALVAGVPGDISVGLRLHKAHKLYWENGLTAEYSSANLWTHRLHFGLTYHSSRFGTAVNSNALKQDNILLSTSLYFRHGKLLRPAAKLNIGYFHADYESAIFDDLPNSSLLLSFESGLAVDPSGPLRFDLTLGFNLITGDGMKGPGTIFPLFYQLSTRWTIPRRDK